MNTYKSKEKNLQFANNSASRKRNGAGNAFRFEDNRPESIAQTKRQERLKNGAALGTSTQSNVVQRYSAFDYFNYEHNSSQPMFTEQENTPQIVSSRSWKSLWMTQEHSLQFPAAAADPDDVNLLVADDKSMAINDTKKEPKEFYAQQSILEESNQKLENVHSSIRLVEHNNTVKVGGTELNMITARQIREPTKDFEDLLNYECFRVAGEVIGMKGQTQSEVVLGSKGNEHTVGINPDGLRDIKVNKLTKALADSGSNISVNAAVKAMEKGNTASEEDSKKYGKRSGRGNMTSHAKSLGINEYANPEVGEAYATYTNPADPTALQDFSRMISGGKPTVQQRTWGYHYAGVVAKSKDGKDSVTLENYNRRDDIMEKGEAIKTKLLEKYRRKLGDMYDTIEGTNANELYVTFHDSQEVAKTFLDEYMTILNSAEPNKAWYFAMYGSKKGQSFHEKQAATGFFANPLTLHVRKTFKEAKLDWTLELDTQRDALQNYAEGHHNETSSAIVETDVIEAIDEMVRAINKAKTHKTLEKVQLKLPGSAIDRILKSIDEDEKSLTLESIGAHRSVTEIASDFSPRFDLVEEKLHLKKITEIAERLKRMI